MLKKLNTLLNIIIGSFIGVFIGYGIYTYWDYKTHPDLYAITSFPWSLSFGFIVAAVVVIAVILKLFLKKR